jgi:hypothetical protein
VKARLITSSFDDTGASFTVTMRSHIENGESTPMEFTNPSSTIENPIHGRPTRPDAPPTSPSTQRARTSRR